MEKIDFTTSHNIVVTVELANTTQRILATLLDAIFISVYASIVALISSGTLYYILVTPVLLCYNLIFEYFNNGQSLGKQILRLKVISLTGERPSLLDLVMRWMFRTIDVAFSVGMMAVIFISSTKKKQRIGDILANTTVIRLKNERNISLKSINNISHTDYAVSYLQVTMYNDSDMLLVKDAIKRVQKRPTDKNTQIIQDLYEKISKDFKIKDLHNDKIKFLKKVINDYVVLTR